MARDTFATAMRRGVFPHEGGYSNHPADPGGCTNFGITIAVARAEGVARNCDELRRIDRATAQDIFRRRYAQQIRYDDLPRGVDYCLLDYAINSGVGRAGKVLRRLVGLRADSPAVNDDVIAAVQRRDPLILIDAICDERRRFLRSLSTYPVFGIGWERRVHEVRALARYFAADKPVVVTTSPVPGKAEVPNPKSAKDAIKGVGAAGGAGGIVAAWDWASAHPIETIVLASAAIALIIGAIKLADAWRRAKQEAPVPDIPVVSESR